MRCSLRGTVIVPLLLFLGVSALHAEQATVIHGVSLRGDPSTHSAPIGHLQKGSTVTLLEPQPQSGFYHVRTPDGTEGWVGVKYLTVETPTGAQASGAAPSGTAAGAASTGCDQSLLDHVYNPERLIVKEDCVSVTGTIVDATDGKRRDGIRHEADGDTHGWLKLDPGFEDLLNDGNLQAEGGNLVFEIVCKFRVTQQDAKPACQGYHSPLKIPAIGSHVRIVGRYVQDTFHDRWNEIHPVTSITVMP